MNMKPTFRLTAALLTATFLLAPLAASAEDTDAAKAKTGKKAEKNKYLLTTCVVTDEKLGEMGDPYVFTYQGKEVQLCCKSCKKDFDKNPKKFVKKLTDAEKKTSKGKKTL
jgi:YHS domain-containing protein